MAAVALSGSVALGATYSQTGNFTDTKPSFGGEPKLQTVFGSIFGTAWSPVGVTNNFSSAAGTLVRLEDWTGALNNDPGATSNMNGSFAQDQYWGDHVIQAKAQARYAGYIQEFGYKSGHVGGTFNSVFTVNNVGFNVGPAAQINLIPGELFRWANKAGGTWSSVASENSDGKDHMITYAYYDVTNNFQSYFLCFEDLPNGVSDFDYNDLVVEVTPRLIPDRGPNLTPSPLALPAGLAALGTLAMGRRRISVR